MNFRPELAEKVMGGIKTVTRRLTSSNPRSPWYDGGCSLKVGHTYAVCPGRGKNAIGRVVILDVELVQLGHLTDAEARDEGFDDAAAFEEAFTAINGTYDPMALVWRIEFVIAVTDGEVDTIAMWIRTVRLSYPTRRISASFLALAIPALDQARRIQLILEEMERRRLLVRVDQAFDHLVGEPRYTEVAHA